MSFYAAFSGRVMFLCDGLAVNNVAWPNAAFRRCTESGGVPSVDRLALHIRLSFLRRSVGLAWINE
jgi:hypothetical protein